jgi:SET domain-containing protein 6
MEVSRVCTCVWATHQHIRPQTDFDVCTTCGAADWCEHDASDDDGENAPKHTSSVRASTIDDDCEIVADAAIRAGEEVFNTYGARLRNAQLLARYGFMLDGNEHDVVSWDLAELCTGLAAPQSGTLATTYAVVLERWPRAACWEESEMVFDARDVDRVGRGKGSAEFVIDADGRPSHDLWVWAGCIELVHQGYETKQIIELLPAVAELQVRLEEQMGGTDEDGGDAGDASLEKPEMAKWLLGVCRILVECVGRRQTWVGRGKGVEEIGTMIDVSIGPHICDAYTS